MTSSLFGANKLNSHELQFALLKHDREWSSIKGSRRGKLDIIAEILLFCEKQKTKTSIMYNTNLNYSQLKAHMDTLLSQGLLAKNLNKYITTERGYRFLELFAQLNDLLEEFTPKDAYGLPK
ncbi:MAG: winged helix-turn-helix domain-containing protein [Candidatus Bathyarchaeota archaeon]|nr:winged helix-turn-helix domain-containing protein [Candidatus Bathyarchaeota archaeon]